MAIVPASVTVPAGATSATFTVTTKTVTTNDAPGGAYGRVDLRDGVRREKERGDDGEPIATELSQIVTITRGCGAAARRGGSCRPGAALRTAARGRQQDARTSAGRRAAPDAEMRWDAACRARTCSAARRPACGRVSAPGCGSDFAVP